MSGGGPREQPSAIGRYRVDGLIGRGAMGMVYLARDEAIERDVAIKTIHRALLERNDAAAWIARFQSEVRAAGRCLHPNIVTVFEYGEHDGLPFIVMELVEGRELRDFLKEKRPLSPRSAVAVMVQVLRALEHAHAHGVVHRDIKPANIIVLGDGQVKVTDFGIARLDRGDDAEDDHAFAVGTPGYMAPEQFRGREVDGRADLYSAGVVLFELLTGQRPFRRRQDRDLMQQVLQEPAPRVTDLNPSAPAALDAILERALAKDPDHRFADAPSFLDALERQGVPFAWDQERLQQLEGWLVEHLGPVAPLMVRRAAERARNANELLEPLLAAIPEEHARSQFAQRSMALMGGPTPTSPAPTSGAPTSAAPTPLRPESSLMTWALGPFDEATLEMVRRDLAVHLGPIARVLVKRAASASRTRAELYQRLARHLPLDADRRAFLANEPNEEGGKR